MKKLTIIILTCLMVSGCGIKPSTVKAPKDAETKIYPRTYPDLNTH